MKTVAKKAVKKVPTKVVAKVATKVAAKKTVKPVKPVSKPAAKSVVKTVAKPVKKPAVKSAAKQAPKAATQKTAKPVARTTIKVATKFAAKPATKVARKAQPVKPVKAVAVPAKKIKVAVEIKAVKAAKTLVKAKAASKPPKEESNLKQPMVIASKIAPPETKDLSPAAPAPSKARTSRLASLTVPSMAQSVASTAAKSSYGPHVPILALIPPPQSAPKHNPKLANNWKTKTAEEMTDAELLAMPDSEYMNIKQMTYFRLKLMQLKQGILESAGATTEHLRDDSAVVPDPTDRATIEEEHALELRTRDRERKLLKKIEQSIARIDAGDYGYCDETGEAIGVGRLLARPTATLSLEAQQRRELKQKMFGD
jgi:DnaK suppressor protein